MRLSVRGEIAAYLGRAVRMSIFSSIFGERYRLFLQLAPRRSSIFLVHPGQALSQGRSAVLFHFLDRLVIAYIGL